MRRHCGCGGTSCAWYGPAGPGHSGGALSCTDILAALYFSILRVDPKNPSWLERDRLVLSAGHKCMALYAALAQRGYFDEALLDTYGSLDSKLPGHPDMWKLPGVEANTGALGHGLSIAGGMAMGLKLKGIAARVYVIMGDGELAEGSNWEAAAAASHHKLDNLLVFVDRNGLQIGGRDDARHELRASRRSLGLFRMVRSANRRPRLQPDRRQRARACRSAPARRQFSSPTR